MRFFVLLSAVMSAVAAAGTNWAVLIAGSNGFYNYRHQADVSHAYQLLTKKGGYPADKVITMMYDDIANSPSNRKPGKIFNRPGGPDVYEGVKIDYSGNNVNTHVFLSVLSGDKAAVAGIQTERVVESGPEDNIFVYYADHGAFGLIAMPSGPYLYAPDLNNTFNKMRANRRFNQLVFYLEACESGSMFDSILPAHENIYAITAANPSESSYAYYLDNELRTYLGDEFSIHWLEDSDVEDLSGNYTLQQQFDVILKQVKQSHPQQYGEVKGMGSLPLSNFQVFEHKAAAANTTAPTTVAPPKPILVEQGSAATQEPVDVRDIEIATLKHMIETETDPDRKRELEAELAKEMSLRQKYDEVFEAIVLRVTGSRTPVLHPHGHSGPREWSCLKESVDMFNRECRVIDGYGFKYVRTLSALCDSGFAVSKIVSAIDHTCDEM